MADNTVDVLIEKIVDDHYDGDCTQAQLRTDIDALITAVRADERAVCCVCSRPTLSGGYVCDGCFAALPPDQG